jgi:hypothetical protein
MPLPGAHGGGINLPLQEKLKWRQALADGLSDLRPRQVRQQ